MLWILAPSPLPLTPSMWSSAQLPQVASSSVQYACCALLYTHIPCVSSIRVRTPFHCRTMPYWLRIKLIKRLCPKCNLSSHASCVMGNISHHASLVSNRAYNAHIMNLVTRPNARPMDIILPIRLIISQATRLFNCHFKPMLQGPNLPLRY